jgi:hypothetical protein
MSDTVILAIIAGFCFFIAVIAGWFWAMWNGIYQECQSVLVQAVSPTCRSVLGWHPVAGWVCLLALIAGVLCCIGASKAR